MATTIGRTRWLGAAAALLALACDSGGAGAGAAPGSGASGSGTSGAGGSGGAGGDGVSAGGLVWAASRTGESLKGIDDVTGDWIHDIDLPGEPSTLVADGAGGVWVGTEEGHVLAFDAESGSERGRITLDGPIEQIAADGNTVWAAQFRGPNDAPAELVHLDPTSIAELGRVAVVGPGDSHDGLLLADGSLWLLVGNLFAVQRLDPATGDVQSTTPLGESPDAPNGARGEFYGYGAMVFAHDTLWVLDDYSGKLLGVNPSSLHVDPILDVSALTEDGGATHLVSDGATFYVSFRDTDMLSWRDGASGAETRSRTYSEGAGAFAVRAGHLYMDADESFGDVIVLDADSGEVQRTLPGAFADLLAAP